MKTKDYCTTCQTQVEVEARSTPAGTDYRCVKCGGQTDFLHDEEDDDGEWDSWVEYDEDDDEELPG